MGEEQRVVAIDKVRVNDQGVMLDMNKDQVAQLPKYEAQGQAQDQGGTADQGQMQEGQQGQQQPQ